MYKSRLAKYGMNKHIKASDMAFILRNQKKRDQQGKRSSFIVHSKALNATDIDRFVRRKRREEPDSGEASTSVATPEYIQCLTEPPSPSAKTPPSSPSLCRTSSNESWEIIDVPKDSDKHSQKTGDLVGTVTVRRGSHSPRLPTVVDPPDLFLRNELLFATIATYIIGSTRSVPWMNWASERQAPQGTLMTFNNLTFQAVDFFEKSDYVAGRVCASKAFSLVPVILREQSPYTLEILLDTFLMIRERGFPELCTMLQVHVRQLAKAILAEGQLWPKVCDLICFPDATETDIFLQSWRCLGDCLSRTTLRHSDVNVKSRANFLRRASLKDPRFGELPFRRLLTEYRFVPSKSIDTELYLVERLDRALMLQHKYEEAEALVEDSLASARHSGCLSNYREARLRGDLATCQYEQGNACEAETNIRTTIALFVEVYGWEGPFVVEQSALLERWLRGWGRREEADKMQATMTLLLEKMQVAEEGTD
jgi:hypothetical protein